ncbi:hypothetical protein [Jiangella aurantiaca]|uniref:hypothetical protein n=1 Tax=Jiangella aurantiaca TaxID=2530373 RepID=UPI0013A5E209|nr:hypothetical protein [Jiangella aurantiaca]
MLAHQEDLSTRDLVAMLNVPLEAIPSVVQETGRLLAARLTAPSAEDAPGGRPSD